MKTRTETGTAGSSSASAAGSDRRGRRGRGISLALLLVGLWAPGLEAQNSAPLAFSIDPQTGAAGVEMGDLLDDPRILEAVHSGLPLRIQLLVQLWKDGFFDDEVGREEWRASLMFDPLTRRYRVQAGGSPPTDRSVNTLEEARRTLQQTLYLFLRPPGPGRYYYIANVEMETLSLTDIEELQRWLRGELGPAVAGEEDVGGALARGLRRVLVRMLDLPARRFQVRSGTFEFNPT